MSVPAHPRTTGTVVRIIDHPSNFGISQADPHFQIPTPKLILGTDERPRSS
jgi:hypothetical protein